MGKCQNCRLEILDETERCPLCQTVLEPTEELENMYPDVRLRVRRMLFASRVYLFAAILLEGVLVGVNLFVYSELWWSALAGLGLALGYIVIRFGIAGKAGYRSKTFWLCVAAVLCAIAADFIIGYRGWSLDYALPIGILAVDLSIVVYMLSNRRNWPSYIMWQLLMLVLSFIPMALFLLGLERDPYFVFLPLAASALLFLGTLLIGGHRAAEELRRRFHFR